MSNRQAARTLKAEPRKGIHHRGTENGVQEFQESEGRRNDTALGTPSRPAKDSPQRCGEYKVPEWISASIGVMVRAVCVTPPGVPRERQTRNSNSCAGERQSAKASNGGANTRTISPNLKTPKPRTPNPKPRKRGLPQRRKEPKVRNGFKFGVGLMVSAV